MAHRHVCRVTSGHEQQAFEMSGTCFAFVSKAYQHSIAMDVQKRNKGKATQGKPTDVLQVVSMDIIQACAP